MPRLKRAIAVILITALLVDLAPISTIQAAQIESPGENISGIHVTPTEVGVQSSDLPDSGFRPLSNELGSGASSPMFGRRNDEPEQLHLTPKNISLENPAPLAPQSSAAPAKEVSAKITQGIEALKPETSKPLRGLISLPAFAMPMAKFLPHSKISAAKTPSLSETLFDGAQLHARSLFPQEEIEPLHASFPNLLTLPGNTHLVANLNGNQSLLPQPNAPQENKTQVKLPKSLWSLFWASSILTSFGTFFYILSQPFLVMSALKESKTMMGVLRNIQLGTMAVVNLLPVGLMVDKTNFRILFVSTMFGRTALMATVPLLFFIGHFSFLTLASVTIANAVFQGVQAIVYGAASNALVGTDGKLNKEASAVITKYSSLAGIIFPIAAGAIVGSLVWHFGSAGYAIAYGLYSLFLLSAIPVYWFGIKDPREGLEINTFRQFFSAARQLIRHLFTKSSKAALQALKGMAKNFQFKRADNPTPAPSWLESLLKFLARHEATQGLAYILKNRILKVWLFSSSLDSLLSDALPMVVFPIFIGKLLVPPAHLPAILASLFGTAGGVLGLTFAVESLGLFLGAWMMQGSRGDALIQKIGVKGFYRISGISSPLFWLMWLFPAVLFPGAFWINLPLVLAVQFLTSLFHAPIGVAMAPVVRQEIPDESLGRVASAFFIVQILSSALGGIAMGVLLDFVSISSAMIIAAVSVTLMGVIDWVIPHWLSGKAQASPNAVQKDDKIAAISFAPRFSYA